MAGGVRGATGIVSLVLITGSLLLMFFVILSGVKNSTPLNKVYFLRADTSSIQGARPITQWTYFYMCGDGNTDCGSPVPDIPFGYAWQGGGQGAPSELIGRHGKHTTSTYYYYMWRFGWVFWLIALAANVMSFFTSLLAPFSRLASGISGFFVANALFWFSIAASLQTTVFVKARNRFHDAGMSATIGKYAMGFTWGAWAAMFLAVVLLFVGCGSSRKETRAASTRPSGKSRFGFFGRRRRATRGSFVDSESQRRVKDEYA